MAAYSHCLLPGSEKDQTCSFISRNYAFLMLIKYNFVAEKCPIYQTLNLVPQKFDKTSASFLSSGKMLANSEEAADIASAMVPDLCDALQDGKQPHEESERYDTACIITYCAFLRRLCLRWNLLLILGVKGRPFKSVSELSELSCAV